MNLLSAPFYSLFRLAFYRQVIRERLSQGFLYLLYLSAVAAVVATVVFMFRFLPYVDRFASWFQQEMPVIVWTPQGLSLERQEQPYTMVHPDFGPLITFDTTRAEIPSNEMGDVRIFITSKKAYVRQSINELRVYDLTQPTVGRQPLSEESVIITPHNVERGYKAAKPLLIFLVMIFTLPFFFIWKLIAAVFYSLIAALMNQFRIQRLNYSQLLNISLFAITPATLIQFLQWAIPGLHTIFFGFVGALLVTSIYLFLAVKKTEEPTLPSPPSNS